MSHKASQLYFNKIKVKRTKPQTSLKTLEIVITAWNEPKTTYNLIKNIVKAIPALKSHGFILKTITLIAPDETTHNSAEKAIQEAQIKPKNTTKENTTNENNKNTTNLLQHIKDPKKGKPYALNLILPKLSQDITIFTDGDVIIKPQAFVKLLQPFSKTSHIKAKVGATTGRPVPINSKKTMLGFWAWLTTQAGAHKHRLVANKTNAPMNLSGYLFAIKTKNPNLMPKKIPTTLKAEDAYFSYLVRKSGYKIVYTPRARVYVLFPQNIKDWFKQKIRAVGGDHQLNMMFKNDPEFNNMRSFLKESAGIRYAILYPKNLREYWYLIWLIVARLILWLVIFWQFSILKKPLNTEGWSRVESTKIN